VTSEKDKFEEIKVVIRSRKSKKNRQWKTDKGQITAQKTK
jgi:hypothetical protein